MFELHHLKCFVALYSELNFHRAATRLNMTQPSLSRQIKLLEHRLGVELFERSKHSVRPTAAGRIFWREAVGLLEHVRQSELVAIRAARGDVGSVMLGFVASAVYDLVASVVRTLSETHPDIEVSLREANSLEQIQGLNTGSIDLGIVRMDFRQPGLCVEKLVDEPFVLALPADHPLCGRDRIDLTALNGLPYVLFGASGWRPFHEMLVGFFRARGVAPKVVQYMNSTLSVLALVRAGIGVSLVPAGATSLRLDGIVYRRVDGCADLHSEIFVTWRADNDNPALPATLALVREVARSSVSPSPAPIAETRGARPA